MTYHKELAAGKWQGLPLAEQLANIGSEIERTMAWQHKGNNDYSRHAFERGLELLDLTLDNKLTSPQTRELIRLREVLVDYFFADNQYGSSPKLWHSYFGAFT